MDQMDRRTHLCLLFIMIAALAGLIGCGAQAAPVARVPSPTVPAVSPSPVAQLGAPPTVAALAPTATPAPSVPAPASPAATCPVTLPRQSGQGPDISNYGRDGLWTKLPYEGVLPLAGPAIQTDGTLFDKWYWWREGLAQGNLTMRARRLDTSSPPARIEIPAGYGTAGLQMTGITFPDEGCWEITGQSGAASLTVVVLVQRGTGR